MKRGVARSLENAYGEIDPGFGKYVAELDLNNAVITKEMWDKPEINQNVYEQWLIPHFFKADVYAVYYDALQFVYDDVVEKSPDRFAIKTTMRTHGLDLQDIILEQIYNMLKVVYIADEPLGRAGIKLIEEDGYLYDPRLSEEENKQAEIAAYTKEDGRVKTVESSDSI